MPGIIVDIGAGDGAFTYQIAKENPDRFIIGIDPNQAGLKDASAKLYKKPSKGGLPNALFVLANIQNLPSELNGIANQIFINFPWGSLLKGVILVEDTTWDSIKKICAPGAVVDMVLGYDENFEANKLAELGLPPLDLSYLRDIITPKLAAKHFTVTETKELTTADLASYPSRWAKKLRFGRERTYFYFQAQLSSPLEGGEGSVGALLN